LTAVDVPSIHAWLLSARHHDDGGLSFMDELVALLRGQGLPLWRVSFSLMTKHPELVWHTVKWHEDSGVERIDRNRRTLDVSYFTASPLPLLQQGAAPFRERLAGSAPLRFPVAEDLRALGGSDYFVQGLPFSTGQIGYISWATRAPGGFDDDWLAVLAGLTPYLAQRIELESAYHATRALLEVYLGKNAGDRVVRGEFRRGGGELIEAAIWFCDLREFTSFSDANDPAVVVATLNAYFERVAGAVMARGGEVLKFIGDAVLAIFPVAGDAGAACRRARLAADDALAALAELNHERAAQGESRLDIGIALHVGQLMYGNVGARDRLDFTVISAAVNETCRLEALCKPLAASLTLSEAFVEAAGEGDVVDRGPQALKGVRTPLRVFTAAPRAPGESPGSR
jgi:adenylate cyclase